MNSEEKFFGQKPQGDPVQPEQEPKELEVEKITRALETEVFATVNFEDYGDPYANVKPLIEALSEAGRSEDIVKVFKAHALHPEDVFSDTRKLYQFTVDKLIGKGQTAVADELLKHLQEYGPQSEKSASHFWGGQYTEEDKELFFNNLRIDLLLAKMRYRQSQTAEVLDDEVDLVGDLIARMPESENTVPAKTLAYLKLAEAKHAAQLDSKSEMEQAERLVNAIPGKDIDKFQWVADLVKTSVATSNSESERHLQMLLQCGYRALHSNDATGEVFKSMIEAMSAMQGKKVDSHMQMMSPQLAASISDPLNQVIQEISKGGNAEFAFQLAELELHEDWTRWEAYAAAIEGLPTEIALPSTVEPRLRELCREVSVPLQRDKFRQLVGSLTNRGQSMLALELIDLTDLESKHKRELYAGVAGVIRRNGGNLESVLTKLPAPRTIDELVHLGQFDEAETVFESLSLRDKIRSGIALIDAFIESGRDIKGVTNKVYHALQIDKPENEYDSEYDWLHDWAPQDLFTTLLKVEK